MREKIAQQRLLLPGFAEHRRSKQLADISHVLDSKPEVLDLVQRDLVAGVRADLGRSGLTAEQVLRILVLERVRVRASERLLQQVLDRLLEVLRAEAAKVDPRRDWGFPNELEENRKATKAERDFYWRGIRRPEVTIPQDSPPSGSTRPPWELLAVFKGSLTERHLCAYLDEYAFKENRRKRTRAQSFTTLLLALAAAAPRPYRKIAARPVPEGYPLSIFRT